MPPTVCSTARTGLPSSVSSRTSASSALRSATSQRTTWPRPSSCDSASGAASTPSGTISTTLSASVPASQRAAPEPRGVEASVTSTVPLGSHSGPAVWAGIRSMRGTNTPEERTANWSSAPPPVSRATTRLTARSSVIGGRSIIPPQRCGCSSPTTRPSPHSCDCSGSGAVSLRLTLTPSRVTHHRGAGTSASPRAWTRLRFAAVGLWVSASRETTPASSPYPASFSASSSAGTDRFCAPLPTVSSLTSPPCSRRPVTTG